MFTRIYRSLLGVPQIDGKTWSLDPTLLWWLALHCRVVCTWRPTAEVQCPCFASLRWGHGTDCLEGTCSLSGTERGMSVRVDGALLRPVANLMPWLWLPHIFHVKRHMKCCPSDATIFLLKGNTVPYLVRNVWYLVRHMWLPSRCTSHSPSAP